MHALFLFILLFVGFTPLDAQARDVGLCPCRTEFPIEDAKIAFMGRLLEVGQRTVPGPDFSVREMVLSFDIVEPWKGVPVRGKIKLKTDDTSCGYGFQLAPQGEAAKTGQVFAIFANEENLSVCSSMVMHSNLWRFNRRKYLHFED